MNILIPINGLGARFKEEGYDTPKPLINIQGRTMIEWVIDNLDLDKADNVFIAYSSEFTDYNFEKLLKHRLPDIDFNFIQIKYETRGATETVLYALNQIDTTFLDNEFMLLDSDTIYFDDIISTYESSDEGNAIFYFKDKGDKPIYSYIKLNNDKVIDIKEKEKISDKANVGCYCFESGNLLKKYAERVINKNKKQKGEFYISSVYSEMIEDDVNIKGIEVGDYSCVGTPIQLTTFASELSESDQRICFDLDNTLVTYPDVEGDYSTVRPIKENIKYARFLKELGNTIIIYTARRMRTHDGNVGKIMADVGKTTLETIDEFNIPCDELHFGKPYADFYVDDLAVKPQESLSKQLGFYNTNVQERQFNNITTMKNKVIKRGAIKGETYWYENAPKDFNKYIPDTEVNNKKIIMERVHGVPLSYLYCNKTLDFSLLNRVMDTLDILHNNKKTDKDIDIYLNYSRKFEERCKDMSGQLIKNVGSFLKEYEKRDKGQLGAIHGDPVFTNILLDKRDNLKFLDMRGKLGTNFTIYGDIFYDYAKIYQSILGYDYILNDVQLNQKYVNDMRNKMDDLIRDRWGEKRVSVVKNLSASLLLSLIPLHEDEKKCNKYRELAKNVFDYEG